jgi:alpha-L-rhamnosidase
MLSQGATTPWEQWNGYWSQIHSCYTSADGWFYQGLAGIRPDAAAPGFKRFTVRPAVTPEAEWAEASFHSPHGKISSEWRREGKGLMLNVTVPVNTTATIYIPARKAASVKEGGKPVSSVSGVKLLSRDDLTAVYEVGSGRYSFSVE